MPGFIYDTGALIAAERSDRLLWALHQDVLGQGLAPTVPAAVLAQGWRGGPQPQMSRLLSGCRIESPNEARARSAGTACALAGTSDVVDAAVVVGASARGDLVITSDERDLQRIAAALGVTLSTQQA
ncbi:twitching motility protein PilT [Candidatus Poriferisodalis sp.]|uniref:twitching motility protein PilT n=1 Tax=Candidatus Poriferisodalis sp. TaxID=3101277 RepID=UPI003AF7E5C1